jgi:hypothetical protein
MCQHEMGSKGCWKPSFLNFTQILQAKGVTDVITCACDLYYVISILRRVVAIGEGSSRLSVLSRGPAFSLFDMLLTTRRGGWKPDVPFVVRLKSKKRGTIFDIK